MSSSKTGRKLTQVYEPYQSQYLCCDHGTIVFCKMLPWGELRKGYPECPCRISYNYVAIYNDFKIKDFDLKQTNKTFYHFWIVPSNLNQKNAWPLRRKKLLWMFWRNTQSPRVLHLALIVRTGLVELSGPFTLGMKQVGQSGTPKASQRSEAPGDVTLVLAPVDVQRNPFRYPKKSSFEKHTPVKNCSPVWTWLSP